MLKSCGVDEKTDIFVKNFILMDESFNVLMLLLIPSRVSEYFELTHFTKEERRIDIFLEERNVTPKEYEGNKLLSKGFLKPITLQDFPMRGHEVFLHVTILPK